MVRMPTFGARARARTTRSGRFAGGSSIRGGIRNITRVVTTRNIRSRVLLTVLRLVPAGKDTSQPRRRAAQ
jgi:hypothetical protein